MVNISDIENQEHKRPKEHKRQQETPMQTVTIYQLNENNNGLAQLYGTIGNSDHANLRAILDEKEESLFFIKNPDTVDTRYSYPLFRKTGSRSVTAREGLAICEKLSVYMVEGRVPFDIVRARVWRTKKRGIQLEFALRNGTEEHRFRTFMLQVFNLSIVRFTSRLGPVYTASLQANLIAAQ